MNLRARLLALFVCSAAFTIVGCQSLPTGPSLSAFEITNIAGQPTIGDRSLCCCHVVGTATNRNTVPLHATITFSGFDTRDKEISKILYFLEDVAPGQTRSINAPGFIVPCNAIARFSWEVKVRAVTYPPL